MQGPGPHGVCCVVPPPSPASPGHPLSTHTSVPTSVTVFNSSKGPDVERLGYGFTIPGLLDSRGQKGLTPDPGAATLSSPLQVRPTSQRDVRAYVWTALRKMLPVLQTQGCSHWGHGCPSRGGTWKRGPQRRLSIISAENSGRWGPGSMEHGTERNTCASAGRIPWACPMEKGCSQRRARERPFQGQDLG